MKLSIKIILLIFSLSLVVNNIYAQKLSKKELRQKAKQEQKAREAKEAEYRNYAVITPSSMEIQKRFCNAIREHDMEKVKTYLDAGASINYIDKYYRKKVEGSSELSDPLTIAVANNDLEMVDFLVKKGANPKFNTVLFTAVLNNDTSMISFLVKLGADINFPASNKYWWSGIGYYNGDTPLEYAIDNEKTLAFVYLLKMGAKPTKEFMENYIATRYYKKGIEVWFASYFIKNYDINVNYVYSETRGKYFTETITRGPALCNAAYYPSRYEFIKLLIEKGADVNKGNPLMTAVRMKNNMKMVKLLVESGANVNAEAYNAMELSSKTYSVLQFSREEYKDYLISKGAR